MDKTMSQKTRKEVLEKLRRRYRKAGMEHRRKLLDQAQELLGYHRKSAVRALRSLEVERVPWVNTGRPVSYKPSQLVPWLRPIWEATDYACGRRLVAMLPEWIAQDFVEARNWYLKAAEQGSENAQFALGVVSAQGHGVRVSVSDAVRWWHKAAAQGNADAQYNLGVSFGVGRGVARDYVEAYKWYNLAAAKGNTNATEALSILEGKMTVDRIEEAQRRSSRFVPRKEHQRSANDSTEPRASGSGFFVTEDGFVVTSYHIIGSAKDIRVKNTNRQFIATVVKTDQANDLAIIRVPGHFTALPISSSREVKLGSSVFTLGFPNPNLQGFSPKTCQRRNRESEWSFR
jgi:hypothetical protein